ncbi:MAG: hypothetical protein CMG57_09215 [Candidatus Marinimicrobia bacterium]|nr:hypothetical protein [Candidatus Neomarinimicrobiota bacterium]
MELYLCRRLSKIMISFILPILDEVQNIEKTIQSIISQTIDKNYEIIVADGMSTDGTKEIIQEYQTKNSSIRLIDNPERIVSTGFNRALSESKGNIILRVDGHTNLEKDFLANCLEVMAKKDVACVGGATIHTGKGIIGQSIALAQSSYFGVGGVNFRKEQKTGKYVDTLAFGAYQRSVFSKYGGYDEELIRNQDDEFNFRIIQNGEKIWLDPSIISTYVTRNSFLKLFEQYFQYGFYKIRVFQKRGGFTSWRHFIPFIFIISLLISIVLFIKGWGIPIKVLLGLYFSQSILFSIIETKRPRSNIFSIIILPFTFFILHTSYGLGSLIGFLFYIKRWKGNNINDSKLNKELFNENTIS